MVGPVHAGISTTLPKQDGLRSSDHRILQHLFLHVIGRSLKVIIPCRINRPISTRLEVNT